MLPLSDQRWLLAWRLHLDFERASSLEPLQACDYLLQRIHAAYDGTLVLAAVPYLMLMTVCLRVAVSVCGTLLARRLLQRLAPPTATAAIQRALAENEREIDRLLQLCAGPERTHSTQALLLQVDAALARLCARAPTTRHAAPLTEPYQPLPFKDAVRSLVQLSAAAATAPTTVEDTFHAGDSDTDAAAAADADSSPALGEYGALRRRTSSRPLMQRGGRSLAPGVSVARQFGSQMATQALAQAFGRVFR